MTSMLKCTIVTCVFWYAIVDRSWFEPSTQLSRSGKRTATNNNTNTNTPRQPIRHAPARRVTKHASEKGRKGSKQNIRDYL